MERLDVLARRVRWLDRSRHAIAVVAALVLGPLVIREFSRIAGADWPDAHLWMLGAVLIAVFWLATEIALAALAAWWETEHAELARERGLPTARLVRRRLFRRG